MSLGTSDYVEILVKLVGEHQFKSLSHSLSNSTTFIHLLIKHYYELQLWGIIQDNASHVEEELAVKTKLFLS